MSRSLHLEALDHAPAGAPGLHVAVVTSDMGAGLTALPEALGCGRVGGDRGVMKPITGCGANMAPRFLVRDGTSRNFTGNLAEVVGCMLDVGTSGCAYTHPLQAARVALTASAAPENVGFLRPDADLLVVFVGAEDDCSAAPNTSLFADRRTRDRPRLCVVP